MVWGFTTEVVLAVCSPIASGKPGFEKLYQFPANFFLVTTTIFLEVFEIVHYAIDFVVLPIIMHP
jgi:hypothetical protein